MKKTSFHRRLFGSKSPAPTPAAVQAPPPMTADDAYKLLPAAAVAGQKTAELEMFVTIGADGFIPDITLGSNDLERLIAVSTWSWVCITKIAADIAALPVVVQKKEVRPPPETAPEGTPPTVDWVNDPTHELNKIVARPLGRDEQAPPWGWEELAEVLSQHLDLIGNAQLKQNKRPSPAALINFDLLNASKVKVEEWPTGVAKSYRTDNVTHPAADIVNIRNVNPGSFWKGIPTIRAAATALGIDHVAHKRIKYDITHRLAPGLVFKVKNLFGLAPKQRADALAILKESHGTAEQSGQPLVIGDQTEIEAAPQPQVGDLPAHREAARDETLAIWGVPPMIAGVTDNATLQFSEVSLRIYWMEVLRPRLGRIFGAINTQSVQPIYGDNYRLWFELADNELGLAVLNGRVGVAKGLHTDLGYSTNDSAARVGLNMPRHKELDMMNANAGIAGRIDFTDGTMSPPGGDDAGGGGDAGGEQSA